MGHEGKAAKINLQIQDAPKLEQNLILDSFSDNVTIYMYICVYIFV